MGSERRGVGGVRQRPEGDASGALSAYRRLSLASFEGRPAIKSTGDRIRRTASTSGIGSGAGVRRGTSWKMSHSLARLTGWRYFRC